MESKTDNGQILIECALALFVIAVLFVSVLDFSKFKNLKGYNAENQLSDLREFRNGNWR